VNFPFTQKNEDGYIVRTFANNVDSEELTWHYDLNERFVICEHDTDWQIQFELIGKSNLIMNYQDK